MREYDAAAEALRDAGGTLVVLTADSVAVLREAIAKQGFGQRFVSVDKAFWSEWGLRNRLSRKLPHPTTLVVAPDSRVVYREIHVNYTQRASVPDIVDLIRTHGEVRPAVRDVPPPPREAAPDWDRAVALDASIADGVLALALDVAPGFHVYGAREEVSRPLAVFVDQLPDLVVPIPDGRQRTLSEALGAAWVLEHRVELRADLPPDAPRPLTGVLDYQICTDAMCAPPASLPWEAR